MPVQLRRGRWDEEDATGAYSSGSDADGVPSVKPVNMSKREWELLQEARELEQGAFAFDKSVVWLLCMHSMQLHSTLRNHVLSQTLCRDDIAIQLLTMHSTAIKCLSYTFP